MNYKVEPKYFPSSEITRHDVMSSNGKIIASCLVVANAEIIAKALNLLDAQIKEFKSKN